MLDGSTKGINIDSTTTLGEVSHEIITKLDLIDKEGFSIAASANGKSPRGLRSQY
jgi:hypothetical protein